MPSKEVTKQGCLHYKCSSQVDTVSKQGEDDEVDGGPHARANASLGADAIVHHLVPVLARQDLQESRPAALTCTGSSHGQSPPSAPPDTETAADSPALQRPLSRERMLDTAGELGLTRRVLKLFHLAKWRWKCFHLFATCFVMWEKSEDATEEFSLESPLQSGESEQRPKTLCLYPLEVRLLPGTLS